MAAFFGAGLSESEPESEPESELEDSTLDFFCGTAAFSEVFLALLELALEAAEAPEAALGLLAAGLASEESESESDDDDSTFFLDFLSALTGSATFLASTFFSLFLSTLTFLGGASDELSESELLDDTTGFFCF